jgi:hypothetical protein
MSWIGLQLVWIDFNALHATYVTIGLALASFPWISSLRDHLPRSRGPV